MDGLASSAIANRWKEIKNELHLINTLKFPRWINFSPDDTHELHGFCDASEIAYAAVLYIKNVSKNTTALIVAKSRVAPLKESENALTIPRLELCAAWLLAKLTKKTMNALEIPFENFFMWSDSKIVLDWINGNPKKYKTFVAGKLCTIKKIVSREHWHHVSSENNPADCASRGILPSQLINHPLWWNGPKFLDENEYPLYNPMSFVNCNTAELIEIDTVNHNQHNILPQVSSFYRFCQKLKAKIAVK